MATLDRPSSNPAKPTFNNSEVKSSRTELERLGYIIRYDGSIRVMFQCMLGKALSFLADDPVHYTPHSHEEIITVLGSLL